MLVTLAPRASVTGAPDARIGDYLSIAAACIALCNHRVAARRAPAVIRGRSIVGDGRHLVRAIARDEEGFAAASRLLNREIGAVVGDSPIARLAVGDHEDVAGGPLIRNRLRSSTAGPAGGVEEFDRLAVVIALRRKAAVIIGLIGLVREQHRVIGVAGHGEESERCVAVFCVALETSAKPFARKTRLPVLVAIGI